MSNSSGQISGHEPVNTNRLVVNIKSSFPVKSLCAQIYNAAADIQALTLAPAEMLATGCLAVAATACQGLYDVLLPHGRLAPLGNFFVILAPSGEGKSGLTATSTRPIIEVEEILSEFFQESLAQYNAKHEIWQTKRNGLKKALEKATGKQEPSDVLESTLRSHMIEEPPKPKGVRILHRDTTPAALKLALDENYPNGLILSDEAGGFFTGPMMREFPFLNDLWSGTDLIVDRVRSGSSRILSPRMSAALMLQPDVFFAAKRKQGVQMRDSGFLARCLICYPESNQGARIRSNASPDQSGLSGFSTRVKELLERAYLDEAGPVTNRRCLEFSAKAKLLLSEFEWNVERSLSPGGAYSSLSDFANKMLEHVCRLAAIFHVIEGKKGAEIAESDVYNACLLVEWYASEFERLIVRTMAPTADQRDAELLHDWFIKLSYKNGSGYCDKTFINRYCPGALRDSKRLEVLLSILEDDLKILSSYLPPSSPRGRQKKVYFLAPPNHVPIAQTNLGVAQLSSTSPTFIKSADDQYGYPPKRTTDRYD